jgi:acetoin utilization protein AcuB
LFVQNCIESSTPFIRLTDKTGYALELMEEFKTDNLAVVEDALFVGTISEKVLQDSDEDLAIEDLKEQLLQQKMAEGSHLFDVLRKASEYSTYFMAVVNAENEYIGMTTPQKILDNIVLNSSLTTTGGIIVLELETKDYSLTEISKIVESNGAMILHSMMATSANQNFMQISLKINKNDLKDIQMSFERYRYTVLAVIHQSEYEVQLKERYDSLMKYLEV